MPSIRAVIAILALSAALSAANDTCVARIAVNGYKGAIALAPGTAPGGAISNADWDKDPVKAKQYVTAYFNAGPEWKKAVMSFTPDKDGAVSLLLQGAWFKDRTQTWTLIDDLVAEGAVIANGGFEDGTAGWSLTDAKDGKQAGLAEPAKSGAKAIKVSDAFCASQTVNVKAGQAVTISFWYKATE